MSLSQKIITVGAYTAGFVWSFPPRYLTMEMFLKHPFRTIMRGSFIGFPNVIAAEFVAGFIPPMGILHACYGFLLFACAYWHHIKKI